MNKISTLTLLCVGANEKLDCYSFFVQSNARDKGVNLCFFRYSQQQQQQVAGGLGPGGQMPLGAHPMMAAWHRGYMENGESILLKVQGFFH